MRVQRVLLELRLIVRLLFISCYFRSLKQSKTLTNLAYLKVDETLVSQGYVYIMENKLQDVSVSLSFEALSPQIQL